MDRIVITASEVGAPSGSLRRSPPSLPVWWKLLLGLLIFIPPMLLVVIVAGLVYYRQHDLTQRYRNALYSCSVLVTCNVFWVVVVGVMALTTQPNLPSIGRQVSPSIKFAENPAIPSSQALSGKDIAQTMSPLVVILHRADTSLLGLTWLQNKLQGAGVIVTALPDGCLILTSKHVVEGVAKGANLGDSVGVTMKDGQEAIAEVVGTHMFLDLAVLWVERDGGGEIYKQPVRMFDSVEIGEQVFAIGHPEGLEFSITGGLVSQKRGRDVIQVSAPISPGNSGGPLFDVNGRLMALVQSVFDKTKNPNAENLNFAERVDDIYRLDQWELSSKGEVALKAYSEKKE